MVAVALYFVGKTSVGMRLMKHIVAGVIKILPDKAMARTASSGNRLPRQRRQIAKIHMGTDANRNIRKPNLGLECE